MLKQVQRRQTFVGSLSTHFKLTFVMSRSTVRPWNRNCGARVAMVSHDLCQVIGAQVEPETQCGWVFDSVVRKRLKESWNHLKSDLIKFGCDKTCASAGSLCRVLQVFKCLDLRLPSSSSLRPASRGSRSFGMLTSSLFGQWLLRMTEIWNPANRLWMSLRCMALQWKTYRLCARC